MTVEAPGSVQTLWKNRDIYVQLPLKEIDEENTTNQATTPTHRQIFCQTSKQTLSLLF